MKIQFREKTFEVNQKTKISDLLKDEIENSEHPVIAAIFNNEYSVRERLFIFSSIK